MDINSVFQLMVAASLERGKTLRVTDRISCDELLRLAGTGLVEILIHGEQAHPALTVKRLTPRGLQVLRAFATPLPGVRSALKVGTIRSRQMGKISGRAEAEDRHHKIAAAAAGPAKFV